MKATPFCSGGYGPACNGELPGARRTRHPTDLMSPFCRGRAGRDWKRHRYHQVAVRNLGVDDELTGVVYTVAAPVVRQSYGHDNERYLRGADGRRRTAPDRLTNSDQQRPTLSVGPTRRKAISPADRFCPARKSHNRRDGIANVSEYLLS